MLRVVRHPQADKTWDWFVERHPHATVAHLSAWGRVIAGAYGHETVYLTAEQNDEVVGALPLVLIKSRLFGRCLVSMPFLDYGGVLAEPGLEREIEPALVAEASTLAREHSVRSLGLRQLQLTTLPYPPADDRATLLLPLASPETVWTALPSERRNRVRKGQKNGLVATWGGAEMLEDFYRVFAVNMRDLGSPVHGRRFFELMLRELPGTARALLVRDSAGRVVGAAVCLFFRDTIMVPWVSSLREAFALCPNFVLYWEVIQFGCQNRYEVLDLGRSFKNTGTFEFKRQWGAAPHTLPWIFIEHGAVGAPSVDRDASRFSRLIDVWKRVPVPLANLVGPWIRGQVPN